MQILAYILIAVVGLFISYIVGVFSLFGGMQVSTGIFTALAITHILATIFAIFHIYKKNEHIAVLALISPAFLVVGGSLLLLECQFLFNKYIPDQKFKTACKDTGVQIFNAPFERVHSINFNGNSSFGELLTKYKVSSHYQLQSSTYLFPARELFVSSLIAADVSVTYEKTYPENLIDNSGHESVVKYTITATDRRNGKKLGTMIFFIDPEKEHACGANQGNTIDIDAFLRKVIAFPGEDKTNKH